VQDRVVLVLGASGGIGGALCRRLAAGGAKLVCASRESDRLTALAGELGATAIPLEATDPAQVEAAAARAVALHGRLDGAVNAVGSILLKPAHLTTDAEWGDTIARNLGSAFYLVRAAARQMREGGALVLVSTAAARTGFANHEAIAAAKGGVIGLTLSAAATYASRAIRVNCVAPGLVETPLSRHITSRETARQASIAMHALGRLGRPEEVASAIAWLLDSEQSWVTGQVLGVDGGLGAVRPR
jgi:NAD(P)-dependent dehydrogenase (short-subunit alcohol dehydrogenase family)